MMPQKSSTAERRAVRSLLSFHSAWASSAASVETAQREVGVSDIGDSFSKAQRPGNEAREDDSVDAARVGELSVLVVAAANGDAKSFEAFYERTVHYASAIARRIVGNNHLEDVLSEAYFQAWRDAARFDASRGNAMAWIVTITRTRALDRIRLENVRHGGLSGAPDAEAQDIEDDQTPGPDTLLEQIQAASALHTAIRTLSANERWCLSLAYYRDLSHQEIASLTGLPLGTVKSLINRSQQKIRELLTRSKALAASKS
jgi:RNA polymerase sigma-70 factor, ECF subfamily